MQEYFPILLFAAVGTFIAMVMLAIPMLVNPLRKTGTKLSTYECGFEEFDSPRKPFDVRFYLVAILFIVFDLEVAFLFPWAMALQDIPWYGFFSMMLFLIILTVGFVYEWKKGALEWE